MRRALLIITIVIVLIAGGYISVAISKQGAAALPGLRVQTENPEANPMTVTPEKGALFFIFTAIALGSLVGMGVTLAILFWFLNRGVARARLTDKPAPAKPADSASQSSASQSAEAATT